MAHGGAAAPNPHIQHGNPPPLPADPRRQLHQGVDLIMHAFACLESEILQLRQGVDLIIESEILQLHIQHRNPPPVQGDHRPQLNHGLNLILGALACCESEILQLRRQAADKDRKIAHLDLAFNQTNARLQGAVQKNAMLLKRWDVRCAMLNQWGQSKAMLLKNWDARCAMLNQWGLSNLKDIGAGKVEEFSKLLAAVARLKEFLIALDGGIAKIKEFDELQVEAFGLKDGGIAKIKEFDELQVEAFGLKDDDDEEEEGGLSKSGKDMKTLLGKSAGLIETGGPAATDGDGQPESAVGDDDDNDEDESNTSPVLAPKKKETPKDEHGDNTPAKSASSEPTRGTTSSSKSPKSKRNAGSEDAKTADGLPVKKVKSDNEPKISAEDEIPTSSKPTPTPKASSSPSSKIEQTPSNDPVTEAEIRSALLQKAPMTTQDLVAIFNPRLKSLKDKAGFVEILMEISKIEKINGQNYLVLIEK